MGVVGGVALGPVLQGLQQRTAVDDGHALDVTGPVEIEVQRRVPGDRVSAHDRVGHVGEPLGRAACRCSRRKRPAVVVGVHRAQADQTILLIRSEVVVGRAHVHERGGTPGPEGGFLACRAVTEAGHST